MNDFHKILSTVDTSVQFVAKSPVKIGNQIVFKEPALNHHKIWLQQLRETGYRIQFLENRPEPLELIK